MKGYWEANAGETGRKLKIFTAGELLIESIRLSLSQLWGAEVLDVYGSAEHDMVAGEFAHRKGFLLAPAYEYNVVSADNQILSPSPSMTGSLAIRRRGQVDWSFTPDRICVLEKATEVDSWTRSLPFKLLGRVDLTASTPDGAVLTEGHVAEIARRIGASAIQVLVDQLNDRTRMTFCCVFQANGLDVALETLEDEVKILSADLGDSIKFGCLQLSIKNVKIEQLELTVCGKLKSIVERWQDGDNRK
jgi:phenylacetate-coenzyme A ligase PaaK-like adenylate-forming protein